MKQSEVYKQVILTIKREFKVTTSLKPTTRIIDLDIDSLDLMMFIADLEKKWHLRIPDDKLMKIITIADLTRVLCNAFKKTKKNVK